MKDNKYAKVEGLLYSYKTLPFVIKGLEIKLRQTKDEKVAKELDEKKIALEQVENMLEYLKIVDEVAYLIIRYWYIDGLQWNEILGRLSEKGQYFCEMTARRKRNSAIIEKLLPLI